MHKYLKMILPELIQMKKLIKCILEDKENRFQFEKEKYLYYYELFPNNSVFYCSFLHSWLVKDAYILKSLTPPKFLLSVGVYFHWKISLKIEIHKNSTLDPQNVCKNNWRKIFKLKYLHKDCYSDWNTKFSTIRVLENFFLWPKFIIYW